MSGTNNQLNFLRELLKGKSQSECNDLLYNVINVMKLSRNGNLCGENFDNLDFTGVPFNEILFSENGKNASSFEGSTLNAGNFFSGHTDRIICAEFTHDEKYIITGSNDGVVILWDVTTGFELARCDFSKHWKAKEKINKIIVTADDRYCVVEREDGQLVVLKLKSLDIMFSCFQGQILNCHNGGIIEAFEFDPHNCPPRRYTMTSYSDGYIDGDAILIIGYGMGDIVVFNINKARLQFDSVKINGGIHEFSFSSNGRFCLFWNNNRLHSLNFINGEIDRISKEDDVYQYVEITSDERFGIIRSENGKLVVLDLNNSSYEKRTFKIDNEVAECKRFTVIPKSSYIICFLSYNKNEAIALYNIENKIIEQVWETHNSTTHNLIPCASGKFCIWHNYNTAEEKIFVLNMRNMCFRSVVSIENEEIIPIHRLVKISDNGTYLLYSSDDNQQIIIKNIVDTEDNKTVTIKPHVDLLKSIYSISENVVLTVGRRLTLWNMESNQILYKTPELQILIPSPKNRFYHTDYHIIYDDNLLSVQNEGKIYQWVVTDDEISEITNESMVLELVNKGDKLIEINTTDDGEHMFIALSKSGVLVCNTTTNETYIDKYDEMRFFNNIRSSYIVVYNNTVVIKNIISKKEIRLENHKGIINDVVFSKNKMLCATKSAEKIIVWHTNNWSIKREIKLNVVHSYFLWWEMCFSEDEKYLIYCDNPCNFHIVEIDSNEEYKIKAPQVSQINSLNYYGNTYIIIVSTKFIDVYEIPQEKPLYSINSDRKNGNIIDIATIHETGHFVVAYSKGMLVEYDVVTGTELNSVHTLSDIDIIGCNFSNINADDTTKKIIEEQGGKI